MLPVEQIIPFIRHDDQLVVDLAVQCLKRVRWPRRLTGDVILDAVRAGHEDLRPYLSVFTPSLAVFDEAIRAMKTCDEDCCDFWTYAVIAQAPDQWLTAEIAEAVHRMPCDSRWIAQQTAQRMKTIQWPSQRIRDRLLETCEKADDAGGGNSFEIAALADHLVYRADSFQWAQERLLERLGSGSWAEVWLFALLRKGRQRDVLPLMFDRFPSVDPDEDEALVEELACAISELCVADDLPRVADLRERIDTECVLHLIEAVGNLRIPEAEPLLLDMARAEGDPGVITTAAMSLCEMLYTLEESRHFVRDLVNREAFDFTVTDLEEQAIAAGIILGRPFEEEPLWRKRLTDPACRQPARRGLFAGLASPISNEQDSRDRADESYPILQPVATLTSAKTVGRNDPCPCGSGRKYKKCCLLLKR